MACLIRYGARTSLVRVDGLENIRRLPSAEVRVTAEDLKNAAAWRLQAEAQRQLARGSSTPARRRFAARGGYRGVDGKLSDWAGADWAVIDRRGVAANFNSDSKPYDITGAVTIAGDRLYAAFRTREAELLKNSGETPNAPFKTGGCLDLMIGANPGADPSARILVAGDERLLITQVARRRRVALPGGGPRDARARALFLTLAHDHARPRGRPQRPGPAALQRGKG